MRKTTEIIALLAVMALQSNEAMAEYSCATKSGYDRIKTGMTYAEVKQTLGCTGEEISSSEMAGFKTVMYAWTAAGLAGSMGGNMNAMFQNDRLINKAQFGLK